MSFSGIKKLLKTYYFTTSFPELNLSLSLCLNSFCVLQEENDINYEAEPEVADEFDSDFDEDVSFLYTSQHFYM